MGDDIVLDEMWTGLGCGLGININLGLYLYFAIAICPHDPQCVGSLPQ